MKLSIVIPTYNEAKNISILIPTIEKEILRKHKGTIIIVDDTSSDGTAEIARKLNNTYHNITVIVRPKKQGIGAALREGYNAAKEDIILSTDADLSFEVKDMLRLLDKINEGYDLVVGSRHLDTEHYEKPTCNTKIKWVVSKYGNKIVRWLSGLDLHDTSANFRAIKREVWEHVQTTDNTNTLLLEMLLKVKYNGYKVTEIPVTFKDRIYGKSKLNLAKEIPKYLIKLIWYVLKFRFLGYHNKDKHKFS